MGLLLNWLTNSENQKKLQHRPRHVLKCKMMQLKLSQKHHQQWKMHQRTNTEKLKFHFSRKNCQKTKKEKLTHLILVLILSKILNLLVNQPNLSNLQNLANQFMKMKKKVNQSMMLKKKLKKKPKKKVKTNEKRRKNQRRRSHFSNFKPKIPKTKTNHKKSNKSAPSQCMDSPNSITNNMSRKCADVEHQWNITVSRTISTNGVINMTAGIIMKKHANGVHTQAPKSAGNVNNTGNVLLTMLTTIPTESEMNKLKWPVSCTHDLLNPENSSQ